MTRYRPGKYQYRVIWRRAPAHDHSATPIRYTRTFATQAAAERHLLVLVGRGHEAYGVDPDQPWDDQTTYRQHYEQELVRRGIGPLVGEPVIERRPIGRWEAVPPDQPTEGNET